MKRSAVRFADLKGLLESMGFVAQRKQSGWLFEHAASGAEFIFKAYRPNEYVYSYQLETVRVHLDWRGLMSPETFDHALAKTPA